MVLGLNLQSARAACSSFGSTWSVNKVTPEAVICTKGSKTWAHNCDTCATWRAVVFANGGSEYPLNGRSFTPSTLSGKYYGAHSPCTDADNYPLCGEWGGNDTFLINIQHSKF